MVDFLDFVEKNSKALLDEIISDENNENLSLYSGYSGAIFFLIELYKNNSNEETLIKLDVLINKAFTIWKNKKESSNNFSLYVGFSGFAFTLLDAFECTKKNTYLEMAIDVLKDSTKHLKEDYKCEILNGISGIIICLIKARNFIKEEWLDNYIKNFSLELISKTKFFDDKGFFWDISHFYKHALSGFSHGNSGVSFTFQHLFQISQNQLFHKIGNEALKYEDNFFSKSSNNWQDLRSFYKDDMERNEYLNILKIAGPDFLNKKKYFNAWCHGTPGIIVNRFYTQYKVDELENVLIKFKESLLEKNQNHSLCHGSLGNLLCLMEITKNKKIDEYFYPILNEAIDFYNKNAKFIINNHKEHKKSLFLGDLGCFYVILKANEFVKKERISSSILFPTITINDDFVLKIEDEEIYRNLLKNSFPNTLSYIEKEKIKIDFNKCFVGLNQNFESVVKQIDDKELTNIIDFEILLNKVLLPKTGYNFNVLKTELDIDILKNCVNEQIKELFIELNENVVVYKDTNKKGVILFSNFPIESTLQSNFILEFIVSQLKAYSSLTINEIISKLKEEVAFEDSEENKIIYLIVLSIKKGLLRLNLK